MNRRLPRAFRLALLLPLLAAGAVPAAEVDPFAAAQQAIRELVRKEMRVNDTVGLSLALVEDQKVTWAEGFGYADREKRIAARPDTRYVTGDLSMLLTATAVLRFVDQGTVDLDQPVQRYLPEFSIRTRFARAGPITVRQLLSHHSGLPAMMLHGMWTPTPEPLATFVAGLRDEYAAAPPGLVYSRSFPGYDVLGRMLAVLCHRPFADCLQERLLEPLDMRDSTFDARLDTASLAMHYWKEQPVASQTVRDVPAAGLRSSVADLARFVELIFAQGQANGQTILKAHSVAEMLRAQNTDVALDLDNRVGFAWRLSGVRFPQTRHVAWLANDAPFSRGRILIAPDQKLGVIVLTNSSGSHEAVRKVSERLMQLILEQRRLPVFAEPPATALTATGPAPTRADIEGDYATIMGLVRVRATDDRYRAELLGKTIDLLPQPVGLLEPEYRLLGLIPIPIANLREVRLTGADIAGRHLAVAYFHNIAHRFGERIRPVDLSEAWRKRLGVYRAVERDALLDLVKLGDVTLAYEDRLLMVRYRVPGWLGLVARVPVRPVSDTELVVEGTGWMAGDTVQARHDQLLRYSGYEFRRVAAP